MEDFNQHKYPLLFIFVGPLPLWFGGFSLSFILTVIILLEIPFILSIFAQVGRYRTFTLNCLRFYILASIVFLGVNIKKITFSHTFSLETKIVLALFAILTYTVIYFSCKRSYSKIELKKMQQN